MVAARSRILALWFTALLLVSIIPAIAPTAAATHLTIASSVRVNGVTYADPTSMPLVKPTDAVNYRFDLTWTGACTPGGLGGASTRLWESGGLEASIIGGSSNVTPTSQIIASNSAILFFNLTVATATAPGAQANAEGPDQKARLWANMTCPAGGLGSTPLEEDEVINGPGLNLDAKRPTIQITSQPAASHTNAVDRQSVGVATTAAIGSDITFTATADDTLSNFSLRTVELNGSSTFWPISSTSANSISVKASGTDGYLSLNGQNVKFTIHAVDDAGNVATQVDTANILVDNVRPGDSTDFRATDAYLHIAPGASASRVDVRWATSAAANDVAHARVTVTRTSETGSTPTTVFASPGVSVPLTFTDPYAAAVNVTLFPIDAAGNINSAAAAMESPPFIQAADLSIQYGAIPAQPVAVTKSGVHNVYVNTTNVLAPTPTNDAPTAPSVFAQLIRNVTTTTTRYWENGTEGSSNANHFQDAGTIDTAAVPTGAATTGSNTAFRPLLATSGVTSAKGAYIFTNLSDLGAANTAGNREFLGGSYQLWLNVSSGGSRTNLVRYFAIDGDLPAAVAFNAQPSGNNNYTRGQGANWTDLHGSDGNPLRVYYAVHDSRADTASGSLTDSKLRNVTFELVTLDGSQVVQRTRGVDDPATTDDERLARVDINITLPNPDAAVPYFYDFRNPTLFPNTPVPSNTCTSGVDMSDSCIWWRVRMNNNWSMSWFNETNLSGWVNLSFPDLPPGKFKVRVLAYDRANGLISQTFPTSSADADVFKVAPAVRILTDSTSPLLTTAVVDGSVRNIMQVTALGSQRYLDPDNNASLSDLIVQRCVRDVGRATGERDICPPEEIQIHLSNSETGTSPVPYGSVRRGSVASTTTRDETTKGFTGTYSDPKNGTMVFSNTGVPVRWFSFDAAQPPEIPASIDITKPVYVRATVYAYDASGALVLSRASDWIRAISTASPALAVSEPTEWQLNITTISGHDKPTYTIQFDRKGEPGVPALTSTIRSWATNAEIVQTGLAPRNHPNNVAPQFVFNWTGRLQQADGTRLAAGAYEIRFEVKDGSSTLATAYRNFTIVDGRPAVEASTVQSDPKLLPRGSGFTVGRAFDINMTTQHNDVNISGFQFALKYPDAPAGTPSEYTSNGDGTGTNGFRVTVTNGLPLVQFNAAQRIRTSDIIASVELPAGVRNNALVILEVTAVYNQAPWVVGNTTRSVLLTFDGVAPAGTLLVADTVKSVFVDGTGTTNVPGQNKPVATRRPSFTGFVEDFGSGIKLVDVRLVDLTDNKTLQLDPSGAAIPQNGIDGNHWASNAVQVVGGNNVQLVEVKQASTGRWLWWLNTTGRTNIPTDIYTAASNQGDDTGIIRLDHRYRVDVRFTDMLDQMTTVINSTEVDFDPTGPYLGYGGYLGTPNNVASGIWTTGGDRTVNWHGESDVLVVTVNVTDNHCIRAVRLVGNSSVNPTTIVKANMTPTWSGPAGKVCPTAAAPVQFTLDLAKARNTVTGEHFFDDVGSYDLWWEAEDWSGQVTEIPATHRKMKVDVLDNTPARLDAVWFDPPVGQAGGRATLRARVFENFDVSHVEVKIGNLTANMTEEDVTATGTGTWRLDTTDDLGLTLDVGEYVFSVTPYDINWNRTISPTCPQICFGQNPLYLVRDDGAPTVTLDSPLAGATLNATPSLKFRAQHKALEISQISVKATTDGNATNLTAVPATSLNFTELKAANGTRQGWTVTYTPGALDDNTTLIVNVSAALASLVDAKQYSFVVDSQAPTVQANVTGTQTIANKTYALSTTRVTLLANDTVSAPTIKYSMNGGAEQTYTGPITPTGPDGEWNLEYWATDPAGNVGVKQVVTLNLDDTGPRITVAKHGDDVLLTVTDGTGAGLNESTVTVHYRYGAASAFTPKKVDKLTGNSFGTTLPGNATEEGLAYYFSAEDVLGNVGSNFSAASPYKIEKDSQSATNLPPTIRITAPTAGASVRNSVDLRWLAEDPEEAPLTISIALRDPAPGRVLVAAGDNGGSYTVNTTGFAAGPYTIVVTVNDGENSASAQVTFTVESGEVIQVRNVPPATVASNTPVSVAVALSPTGKTVAQATYRLLKDGVLATSGLLTPQQGLYAAGFTPSGAGNYTVIIEVLYTDGTTEPPKQVATFRVPAPTTPPGEPTERGVFPVSLMALVAIAVLTVALGAYGAFGRWKK